MSYLIFINKKFYVISTGLEIQFVTLWISNFNVCQHDFLTMKTFVYNSKIQISLLRIFHLSSLNNFCLSFFLFSNLQTQGQLFHNKDHLLRRFSEFLLWSFPTKKSKNSHDCVSNNFDWLENDCQKLFGNWMNNWPNVSNNHLKYHCHWHKNRIEFWSIRKKCQASWNWHISCINKLMDSMIHALLHMKIWFIIAYCYQFLQFMTTNGTLREEQRIETYEKSLNK